MSRIFAWTDFRFPKGLFWGVKSSKSFSLLISLLNPPRSLWNQTGVGWHFPSRYAESVHQILPRFCFDFYADLEFYVAPCSKMLKHFLRNLTEFQTCLAWVKFHSSKETFRNLAEMDEEEQVLLPLCLCHPVYRDLSDKDQDP